MIGSLPAAGRVIRRVLVQPAAALSVTFIVLLALLATFAGALGLDPLTQDVARMLEGPSRDYPFGTDELGRDILARVVYGARTSLVTAAGAVRSRRSIGVPIGLIAGFFGGWRDAVLMRIVDLLLALPGIMLALALIAVLGRSQTRGSRRGRPHRRADLRARRPGRRCFPSGGRDFVTAVEAFGARPPTSCSAPSCPIRGARC